MNELPSQLPPHKAFSSENTFDLETAEEKRVYHENVVQLAWFGRNPDMLETEFAARSKWFRETFLPTSEGRELLNRFKLEDESEGVLDRMEALYVTSVTKH